MQIFVQIHKTYTLNVSPNDSIVKIKQQIQDKTGIATDKQRLAYNGKQLQCDKSLEYYNIIHFSIINVIISASQIAEKTSIVLSINVHDVLHFIEDQSKSVYEMDCDENTTIHSILKAFDIMWMAHSIRVDVVAPCGIEQSFLYSQIVDKPLFTFADIIHNTIEVSLHCERRLPPQALSNRAFVMRMTAYFQHNNQDKRNALSLQIISQIISSMSTLKSNDELLYESTLCLAEFVADGVCAAFIKDTTVDHLLHVIFKLLSYQDNGGYTTKIRPILSDCLVNIASKGDSCKLFVNQIMREWSDLADLCRDRDCLLAISKFYKGLCNSVGSNVCNTMLESLHLLLFYEDDQAVLASALRTYFQIVGLHRSIFDIKKAITDDRAITVRRLLGNKQCQSHMICEGYLRQLGRTDGVQYVNDITCVIFHFYNGYRDLMNVDILKRLVGFLDKNNGYIEVVRTTAWNMTKAFMTPLNELSNTFNAYWKDHRWFLYPNIRKHGMVQGLIVIMGDALTYNETGETGECISCKTQTEKGKFDSGGNLFHCAVCWKKINHDEILFRILSVLVSLMEEESIRYDILKQLHRCSGVYMDKIRQYIDVKAPPHIKSFLQNIETTPFAVCGKN
eukprot:218085_1